MFLTGREPCQAHGWLAIGICGINGCSNNWVKHKGSEGLIRFAQGHCWQEGENSGPGLGSITSIVTWARHLPFLDTDPRATEARVCVQHERLRRP